MKLHQTMIFSYNCHIINNWLWHQLRY